LKREEEKNKIIAALQRHNGNQTAAAKELGISRVTLWRKKTMYHI
jgi:transcriptional regulator of acetoin/glycerol metabolism